MAERVVLALGTKKGLFIAEGGGHVESSTCVAPLAQVSVSTRR